MITRRSLLGSAAALTLTGIPHVGGAQTSGPVRIGISPAETYAQPIYGRDAGIFAKDGLNVEVIVLSTGAAVASALAGGSVDVGVSTVVNIANAITRGIPFVMIAPAGLNTLKAPSGLLLVPKNSPIRTARDLEGKSVAIPALRQVVDLALRVWLTKGGADPAKVQIVEAPFPEMGPGVERGIYGAAIISEPSLSNALKNNNLRSLGDPYASIAPEYPIGGWATTTGFVQKNPALVQKVAAALIETARWANTHHDETAQMIARVTKIDPETIRHGYRVVYGTQIRASEIQPQLDAALKFGFLTRPVTVAELLGR